MGDDFEDGHVSNGRNMTDGVNTGSARTRVVERNGEPLHLTPIEYRLLTHLAA